MELLGIAPPQWMMDHPWLVFLIFDIIIFCVGMLIKYAIVGGIIGITHLIIWIFRLAEFGIFYTVKGIFFVLEIPMRGRAVYLMNVISYLLVILFV